MLGRVWHWKYRFYPFSVCVCLCVFWVILLSYMIICMRRAFCSASLVHSIFILDYISLSIHSSGIFIIVLYGCTFPEQKKNTPTNTSSNQLETFTVVILLVLAFYFSLSSFLFPYLSPPPPISPLFASDMWPNKAVNGCECMYLMWHKFSESIEFMWQD